ncbi:MAG: serine/threonine protein kinase [Bradymonadia bacterium]
MSAPTCERDGAPLAQVFAHQTRGRFPLLGKVVGDRYRLIGGLGKGGLGTVYLAEHQHLGHLFAIKFLELGGEEASDQVKKDRDRHRRDFLKEARVASLIRHPSVVGVTDFGEHEDLPFLVMDYVPGPSLLQEMERKGRFSYKEACDIALRIAEALNAFHERRLVHRDLKPANLILDPREDGRLTLVDLGLVKDLAGPGGKDSTHPLALRGTPGYLAPEQVPGWVLQGAGVRAVKKEKKAVDPRVDIYALGVILYEMLAGEPPYPDGSNTQVIVYACTQDPKPLHALDLPIDHIVKADPPVGLEKLVLDTMSRDRDTRPASAAEFIERLKATMAEIERPAPVRVPINASALTALPGLATRPGLPSSETMPDDSMGSEYDTMVFDTNAHPDPDDGFDLEDSLDEEAATVAGPMPEIIAEARAAQAAQVAREARGLPTEDDRPGPRLGLWIGLLGVVLAAAAGVWWALSSNGSGDPVDRQTIDNRGQLPVGSLPETPATPDAGQPQKLDAELTIPVLPLDPPEEAPDAQGAAASTDAGASKPTTRRRKRRRRATPPVVKDTPTVPPRGPTDDEILVALLREGDSAFKRESYQRALRNYRKFLARAPQSHAKYFQVKQRVRSLEQLTAYDR